TPQVSGDVSVSSCHASDITVPGLLTEHRCWGQYEDRHRDAICTGLHTWPQNAERPPAIGAPGAAIGPPDLGGPGPMTSIMTAPEPAAHAAGDDLGGPVLALAPVAWALARLTPDLWEPGS